MANTAALHSERKGHHSVQCRAHTCAHGESTPNHAHSKCAHTHSLQSWATNFQKNKNREKREESAPWEREREREAHVHTVAIDLMKGSKMTRTTPESLYRKRSEGVVFSPSYRVLNRVVSIYLEFATISPVTLVPYGEHTLRGEGVASSDLKGACMIRCASFERIFAILSLCVLHLCRVCGCACVGGCLVRPRQRHHICAALTAFPASEASAWRHARAVRRLRQSLLLDQVHATRYAAHAECPSLVGPGSRHSTVHCTRPHCPLHRLRTRYLCPHHTHTPSPNPTALLAHRS